MGLVVKKKIRGKWCDDICSRMLEEFFEIKCLYRMCLGKRLLDK